MNKWCATKKNKKEADTRNGYLSFLSMGNEIKEIKKMKASIGLTIHDNDFATTLEKFLEIIKELDFEPTKEQVKKMFIAMAPGIYLAFQNEFKYGDDKQFIYLRDEYFPEVEVYIEDEIASYIEACDADDNGEFFYITSGDIKQL